MKDIDKEKYASVRTYQVTLIDSYVRPKNLYEKVTQVASDWAFPAFLAALLYLVAS
ncbi:hypothetical protein [Vibrio aestuarianus]|uniref:Uncharacterized protein n=1 Tax=Vibrio aestuarianus TaxID=28171 RepID=A0ABM9FS62_9VIBR|nr:hypothetical protein [Vibrio aestuarianus]MDE1213796.1 hypothetical protein [Vibrio aestuarianus]MDE1217253.1 hypothetical protein [Vibrio aestuarianus]MDE1235806.1 hypothetical protein [Vibrio aestuarianus]MDE1246638.1 hypothetical protein [Vibrio aestuarianus]MDE1256994.1 hypothetical protein [Vibrio aestuarianus]